MNPPYCTSLELFSSKTMLRIITFNANGIRSCGKKGFFEWFLKQNADILCIQELKAQEQDIPEKLKQLPGYYSYFHCAEKKGYSGCGFWSKVKPMSTKIGYGNEEFDREGRYLQADFKNLSIISSYFPSGSSSEERQQAKWRFLNTFLPFFNHIKTQKQDLLLCGDINIAHENIDIKNWKGNLYNSGFTPEERQWITELFSIHDFCDVFRKLAPSEAQYTWWSQRGKAREKNVGWRIDYQIGTSNISNCARTWSVYSAEKFSDHAPLIIDYDFSLE